MGRRTQMKLECPRGVCAKNNFIHPLPQKTEKQLPLYVNLSFDVVSTDTLRVPAFLKFCHESKLPGKLPRKASAASTKRGFRIPPSACTHMTRFYVCTCNNQGT